MKTKLLRTKDYLLLIDEEAEIKYNCIIFESDTCLINVVGKGYVYNKTDFKIIAYCPLNSEAKELNGLPLLPNPFNNKEECYNKDAIIKAFYTDSREWKNRLQDYIDIDFESWFEKKIKGNKEYIETNHFTLEDIRKAFIAGQKYGEDNACKAEIDLAPSEEQYIQSLSTQQLPKEFIPEYEIGVYPYTCKQAKRLKTTINSEGKKQLVGTYKY